MAHTRGSQTTCLLPVMLLLACAASVHAMLLPVGGSCTGHLQCLTRRCINGRCALPKKLIGESCASPTECLLGHCRNGICTRSNGFCTQHSEWADCERNEYCEGMKCKGKLVGGDICSRTQMCASHSCVPSKGCLTCRYCAWAPGASTAGRCSSHSDCGNGEKCRYKQKLAGTYDYGTCAPCVKDGEVVFHKAADECCSGKTDGATSGNAKCVAADTAKDPPGKFMHAYTCPGGNVDECPDGFRECRKGRCYDGTCWSNIDCLDDNMYCGGEGCFPKKGGGERCKIDAPGDSECRSNKCISSTGCTRCGWYCDWAAGESTAGRCKTDADCGKEDRCRGKLVTGGGYNVEYDWGRCARCVPAGQVVIGGVASQCCSGVFKGPGIIGMQCS